MRPLSVAESCIGNVVDRPAEAVNRIHRLPLVAGQKTHRPIKRTAGGRAPRGLNRLRLLSCGERRWRRFRAVSMRQNVCSTRESEEEGFRQAVMNALGKRIAHHQPPRQILGEALNDADFKGETAIPNLPGKALRLR